MVRVKICGITREKDLEAAVDAGADLLGFVVDVPSSPRNIPVSKAKHLASQVPSAVSRVAVTVFRGETKLKKICSELEVEFVQLHGNLSLLATGEFLPERPVIGAVDVAAPNAIDLAVKYSDMFSTVLLDTAGKGGVGGTGVPHDWDLSSRIGVAIQPVPIILAGGLTPKNVGEAIQKVRPHGVDVSSGVEKRPGIKDHDRMREFVTKAKETEF